MKSRITHTSHVIDFLNHDFDSKEIGNILKSEIDEILSTIEISELERWEIVFKAIYTKSDSILVFKKTKSYIDDKYKEIAIHVPVPNKSEVTWGVDDTQFVKLGSPPNLEKNATKLEIDCKTYSNRAEYIMEAIRKAIYLCFETGFTINGVKVKKTVNQSSL